MHLSFCFKNLCAVGDIPILSMIPSKGKIESILSLNVELFFPLLFIFIRKLWCVCERETEGERIPPWGHINHINSFLITSQQQSKVQFHLILLSRFSEFVELTYIPWVKGYKQEY